RVDQEPEMTELDQAVADRSPEAEDKRLFRLQDALYGAVKKHRQVDLVKRTGLTRETIRRHVEDARIRRGEIAPTPRYLREQAKRDKRREP
ncbi:MAG TPA: hypothetical protein VK599_16235, partial [Streptosporangiaceae bacterium]|nr:hypothetical protein [Streptosporangiaceae bacterium]